MMDLKKLNKIREEAKAKVALRQLNLDKKYIDESEKHNQHHILVCGGTGCHSLKGDEIAELFKEKIKLRGLEADIKVKLVGCFGLCATGTNVVIYPEGAFYSFVTLDDVEEIVDQHIIKGKIVRRRLFGKVSDDDKIETVHEVDFYKRQTRIALRNCGVIAPDDIDEYIAFDGYQALGMSLTQMSQSKVIKILKDAKLRGRGGAGFPLGIKWEAASLKEADQKYIICNADEGDPGAFMDRSILEGDPHSIIEAMTIAGYAVGANKGYVYVRAEYPIAVDRLKVAMAQAKEYGLLGNNLFGTDFSFDVEIRLGAGAFVCGEETALIESIEGKRGMPRAKVYITAHRGLWNKPTIVNNVETLANVPIILQKGADWFKSIGTEDSPGTKVFALSGNVKNTGLIEVPMGTTLSEIIYDIGGGTPDGSAVKAVQTGGPSGGCIPPSLFDTKVDYKSLEEIGSIMGSGGMVVMDEGDCMVDIAKFFMDFTVDESCGKCTPCRIGNKRVLEILERISEGSGKAEDLVVLEDLCHVITDSSLCGLGKTATNPVLSSMHYFREEYEEHVLEKKCKASVCSELLRYFITDNCIGCGICKKKCPVDAISGDPRGLHVIDLEKCIKCNACLVACPVNAIIRK